MPRGYNGFAATEREYSVCAPRWALFSPAKQFADLAVFAPSGRASFYVACTPAYAGQPYQREVGSTSTTGR